MIRQISIPALDSRHVAKVLTKFWGEHVVSFPTHTGSYVIVPFDEQGTMIKVSTQNTELIPGIVDQKAEFSENSFPSQFNPLHAALDVPASLEQIEEIAACEGWRVVLCDRGPFKVIEFWIENRLLLELLTPEMVSEYINFIQPQNLEQVFAAVKDWATATIPVSI